MNAIGDAFSDVGHEETAIIVRSNKRANLYNQNIRDRILFKDAELCAGDFLMVVKKTTISGLNLPLRQVLLLMVILLRYLRFLVLKIYLGLDLLRSRCKWLIILK